MQIPPLSPSFSSEFVIGPTCNKKQSSIEPEFVTEEPESVTENCDQLTDKLSSDKLTDDGESSSTTESDFAMPSKALIKSYQKGLTREGTVIYARSMYQKACLAKISKEKQDKLSSDQKKILTGLSFIFNYPAHLLYQYIEKYDIPIDSIKVLPIKPHSMATQQEIEDCYTYTKIEDGFYKELEFNEESIVNCIIRLMHLSSLKPTKIHSCNFTFSIVRPDAVKSFLNNIVETVREVRNVSIILSRLLTGDEERTYKTALQALAKNSMEEELLESMDDPLPKKRLYVLTRLNPYMISQNIRDCLVLPNEMKKNKDPWAPSSMKASSVERMQLFDINLQYEFPENKGNSNFAYIRPKFYFKRQGNQGDLVRNLPVNSECDMTIFGPHPRCDDKYLDRRITIQKKFAELREQEQKQQQKLTQEVATKKMPGFSSLSERLDPSKIIKSPTKVIKDPSKVIQETQFPKREKKESFPLKVKKVVEKGFGKQRTVSKTETNGEPKRIIKKSEVPTALNKFF